MLCRFTSIWTVQKDAFFRRWRAQDPRVSDFDQAITQYIELSNKAQQVDTLTNVEFILLDCSPLKFSIIAHCEEWQNRFHNLLLDLASSRLNEICAFLSDNSKKLVHYNCTCTITWMYTVNLEIFMLKLSHFK